MFRIITLVLFTIQIVIGGAVFIWVVGKLGFDPAQPYMAGIETMFSNIWQAIRSALNL